MKQGIKLQLRNPALLQSFFKTCKFIYNYKQCFNVAIFFFFLEWSIWHLFEFEKNLLWYSPHLLSISSLFHCHEFISSPRDFQIGSASIPLFSQPPFSFILSSIALRRLKSCSLCSSHHALPSKETTCLNEATGRGRIFFAIILNIMLWMHACSLHKWINYICFG